MINHMVQDNYNMSTRTGMWVSSTKALDKEKDNIFIVKEQCLKGFGKMIKNQKANLFFLMEIFSKDSLKIIYDTMVCTGIKMEIHMREPGKMMLNKVLGN